MVVYVNNIEIEFEDGDTPSSILYKYANKMQVLPKYLEIDENIKIKDKNKIKIIDLIEEAKKRKKKSAYTLSEFLEELEDNFLDLDNLEKLKILLVYGKEKLDWTDELVLNEDIKNYPEIKNFLVENFIENEKKSFLNGIKSGINEMNKLFKIKEGIKKLKEKKISDFELEKTKYIFTMSLENTSLAQVFDDIVSNEFCPYFSYNNYYKIFKGFKIPTDIIMTRYNVISGKILNKKYVKTKDYAFKAKKFEQDYDDMIIYYDEDEKLKIEVSSNIKNITEEILKKRILDCFENLKLLFEKVEKDEIKGLVFMADTTFNKYILSDLIQNNLLYTYFLSIDESLKASKTKKGLYISFFDQTRPELGLVKANIIPKKVRYTDLELRNKSKKDFELDSNILRIKITFANTYTAVEYFLKIFGKLMNKYNDEKNKIIDFYKVFIPNFGEVIEKEKEIEEEDISKINPDLFMEGYSRKCSKRVSIIGDDEKWKGDDLIFPRSPEEGPQFRYVCKHKEYPYPGIQVNKLPNSDEYPFIPCCYKTDQKNEVKYLKYYEGIDKEVRERESTYILTSNKIAKPGELAYLPSNLNILFKSFDSNLNFYRQGVVKSENSFLECILEALDYNFGDEIDERKAFVSNFRKKDLANSDFLSVCKQECYDMTISKIKDSLKDDTYLDPKLYVTLLEEYFDINIYLFEREFEDDEAEMILPRHTNGHFYYKRNPKRKNLLIYIHNGIESDLVKYPQCELISYYSKEDPSVKPVVKNLYSGNEIFTKKIYSIYKILNDEYYILDKQNKEIEKLTLNIENQYVDQFGKTRALRIKSGNEIYNIFCSPIPPLKVKLLSFNNFIEEYPKDKVEKLLKNLKVQDAVQILNEDNKVTEVSFIINEVNFSVRCNKCDKFKDLTVKKTQSYLNVSESSNLDSFRKNKTISTLLTENFIYCYSEYLHKLKELHSLKNLDKFVKSETIIIKDYSYDNVEKDLSFDKSNQLYKNKKLIIDSENTLKSLVFITQKYIERYSIKFEKYYKFKYVQNFYKNISDFEQYPTQYLFYGKENIIKFLELHPENRMFNKKIKLNYNLPYFLYLNNNLYLTQSTDTMDEAIYKSYIFNTRGYNPKESEKIRVDEYTILYINSILDIKEVKIGQKDESMIGVYKHNNQLSYLALMKV